MADITKFQVGDILQHDRLDFFLLVEDIRYEIGEYLDYDTDEYVSCEVPYITCMRLDTGERLTWNQSNFYSQISKVA